MLATVLGAPDVGATAEATASRTKTYDDERLLELRDDVSVAKPEDLPALFEQMHTLGALRAQRGRSVSGSVDRASPYFLATCVLEEAISREPPGATHASASPRKPCGRSWLRRRDVLIGSRLCTSMLRSEGIRIVDWRQGPRQHASYYRYAEGDDYEEELGKPRGRRRRRGPPRVTIVAGKPFASRRCRARSSCGRTGNGSAWPSRSARLETEKRWTNSAERHLPHPPRHRHRRSRQTSLPAIASARSQAVRPHRKNLYTGLASPSRTAPAAQDRRTLHRVGRTSSVPPLQTGDRCSSSSRTKISCLRRY